MMKIKDVPPLSGAARLDPSSPFLHRCQAGAENMHLPKTPLGTVAKLMYRLPGKEAPLVSIIHPNNSEWKKINAVIII
jgi:hypothetical protein